MQALILAGGKATRLRPLSKNIPKALLPIGNLPFIIYQLKQLKYNNISDVIMSIGHLGEEIIAYLSKAPKVGVTIKYSKEEKPLGTAGALKLSEPLLNESFLVLNGDSFSQISYNKFIESHRKGLERWQNYLGTIALMGKSDEERYGNIILDDNNIIINFKEKKFIKNRKNFLNRGIYIFQKKALEFIPQNCEFSLEEELIPFMLSSNYRLGGFKVDGFFIDIGTLESYQKAIEDYKNHKFPEIFYQ